VDRAFWEEDGVEGSPLGGLLGKKSEEKRKKESERIFLLFPKKRPNAIAIRCRRDHSKKKGF